MILCFGEVLQAKPSKPLARMHNQRTTAALCLQVLCPNELIARIMGKGGTRKDTRQLQRDGTDCRSALALTLHAVAP